MGMIREVLARFQQDRALSQGAALAYYAVFSIAPLLVLVIAIAGMGLGQVAAEGEIVHKIREVVGPQGASMIEDMIREVMRPASGIVATVVSFATMFVGASGAFVQLQTTLNDIFRAEPRRGGIRGVLRQRLAAFAMILGIGVLLLTSLALSAVLSAAHQRLIEHFPVFGPSLPMLNFGVSFVVLTALLVLVATVIPWLAANPMLRFFLPTVELVAAIAIGSIVCLGLAEVSSRGFGTAFVRGAREQEATRQLAASRDAYRDLAENASDLIYTHDLEGRFTYVNEAFARFAGAPLDAIVGRLSRELVVDMPERPDIPAIIARVAAGELVPPQILPVDSATGFRWIECAISAIRDSSDRVTGIRGIARDVTARRDAEERLRASLAELRDSEERLRLLAQRQAMIREEERKRIGFDLHDDVCQELVGIGIILESLRRGAHASSMESARDLERIGRYLNEVVEHLRLLAHDLRPLLLRDLGLEGSLRSLADGMSSPTMRVVATFATAVPRLAEEAEIGVYRIAQEALVNAARHAGAGSITITLRILDATLHLDVRDDGCGFVAEDRQRRPNLGLVGMQERALALGGRRAVWSEPGKGTAVHLECPVLGCAPASAA